MPKVKRITPEEAAELIERWCNGNRPDDDLGKFYCTVNNRRVVAIDNDDGNCWVEDFRSVSAARHWLLKYE